MPVVQNLAARVKTVARINDDKAARVRDGLNLQAIIQEQALLTRADAASAVDSFIPTLPPQLI